MGKKRQERKGIIEIQEDTRIGDYILEKGDKIEVLKEYQDRYGSIETKYGNYVPPKAQDFDSKHEKKVRKIIRELDSVWDDLLSDGWDEMRAGEYLLDEVSKQLENVFGGYIKIEWEE